jgi:hypothetical protein
MEKLGFDRTYTKFHSVAELLELFYKGFFRCSPDKLNFNEENITK